MKRKLLFITLLMLFCSAVFGQQHWTMNNQGDYTIPMTVYANVSINGVPIKGANYEMAAFHGEELRGVAIPEYDSLLEQYIVTLTVYGKNIGDEISFKLFDPTIGDDGEELETDFKVGFRNDPVGQPIFPQSIDFYEPYFDFDAPSSVENYMGFGCAVKIDGVEQNRPNLEIAAFKENGEVCGCARSQALVGTNIYIFSLPIYAQNGETISFKLFDPTIGEDGDVLSTDYTIKCNVNYDSEAEIVYIDFKNNAVAQIGSNYYATLEAALAATIDNDVVTIIKSTNETIGVPAGNNVTIKALEGVELSGGAGGSYYNKSVTFDGLTFKGGKGIALTAGVDGITYTVKNCTFDGVQATAWKQGVISLNGNATVVVENNIITDVKNATEGDDRINTYGQQSAGIYTNNAVAVTISGNAITNVDGTGISSNSNAGKVDIKDNNISVWGTGATAKNEGRAIRTSGGTEVAITGNVMIDNGTAKEEFVKATGMTVSYDASENYWSGKNPLEEGIFDTDFAKDPAQIIDNYYTDAEKSNLVELAPSVAKIGDTYYATLEAALDAATEGCSIDLLADVEVNETIIIEKNISIDLSGMKITSAMASTLFKIKAEVSIDKGTIEYTYTGNSLGSNFGAICTYLNSNLTLGSDLSVIAHNDCPLYAFQGDVISYANLSSDCVNRSTIFGHGTGAGNLTVNGGMITGDPVAVFWPGNGKLTVNGGEFEAGTGIYIKSGSLEITGGKFTATGENEDYQWSNSGCYETGDAVVIENVGGTTGYEAIGSVIISGGTFISTNGEPVASYAGTQGNPNATAVIGFIKGGAFNKEVEESLLAAGYALTENNGMYEVSFADYIVLPSFMDKDNYEGYFGTNTVTDGINYYATLQAAVEAVVGQADAILYCKPGADVGELQHAPVTNTLTVYGNDAYVSGSSERDFDLGNTDPNGPGQGQSITADMTLTVKHLDGCGAWGTKSTEHTVNLVFENCDNMGKIYITGQTGILNITMTDCAFEGVIAEALYSNADGNITLTNVDFSNLNKAVNLNHKAAGTQTVTMTGCTFTGCGNDVSADQIPVRVLTSVEGGRSELTVTDCTFTGTPTGGADILLDYGVGITTATVSNTVAYVVVEREANKEPEETTTSAAQTYTFDNRPYVAEVKVGEDLYKYKTIADALTAVPDGGTITLINNVTEEFAIDNTTANITLDMAGFTLTGAITPSKAKLTIENGTINNENASYSAIEINAGTLVLNDVKVTSKRHGVRIDGAVDATINGGEYRLSATSGTRHAVNVSGDANVTIKAGTFVGPAGTTMDSGSAVCVQTDATVTIEGGDFSKGKNATLGVSGEMIVKGGTFDQDPSAYLAQGYVAVKNGNVWTVGLGVAELNGVTYVSLQTAIDAAVAGDNTIQLLANIDGDVTILQQEGINIVIDGKKNDTENYTFNGTINIYGNARNTGTETLKIQNVNFYTEDSGRYFIEANEIGQISGTNNFKQYAHNVTVENCNFATSAGNTNNEVVGMRFRQAYNMSAVNCTSDGIFSIMWTTAVEGLTLNKVVATNCKEGITIGGASKEVNIIGGTIINSETYAIRAEGAGSDFTIENSTLVAKVPVVVRNVTDNSKISFTFKGTNTITESNPTNYWFVAGAGVAYQGNENEQLPAITGQVTVVLNDTGLSYDGVYGNYGVAKIGDVVYTTFNDAYNAATENNNVITLLDNITLTETMTIEKAITLDLGTNTVTGADGAIVFNVKAATTIMNGTVIGNKSGTSSGLIDIYANLDLDGVTIETSKINALRFKAGECTATLTNCNVTGAFKGYGGSVWEIKSGTYKASSTAINDQLNGTASISGGTFHYEIAEDECAPGYVVQKNGDGTWTVKYAPAAFVDANNNGTLDEGEAVYGNLDQIFAKHKEGDVYVVLTSNIVANAQVDTDDDAHYHFTTNVAEGVTMDFLFADDWNYIQKMSLGQNITLNAKHLLAWTVFNVSGTINTDYLYTFGAATTIESTGVVYATTDDATIQVKDNATFTVKGEVYTAILNVWVNNAKLIVDGEKAKVDASWVDIWDGAPSVTVQNGATLATSEDNGIKASRGGSITVNSATLTGKIQLGHNGESAGELTVTGNSTLSPITLTVVGSTVSGPENLTVTSGVDGYGVNYFEGVYSLVEIEIQETELFKGWNWFSAYVDINGEEGLTKIQNALAGNATLMKSHTAFGTYYNEMWINNGGEGLSSASVTEMYMIQMKEAMTGENKMQLEGNLVNPSEHTIQLYQNWNWIGYPSNEPINLVNAFDDYNDFTPQNGDRIKSHVGFSQYYGENSNEFGIIGWWGTLNTMTPGLGYMYYRAGEATSFKYNVPADGAKSELRANITADDNYWVPATHRYANNMTMVAMLEGANADNYEVAAFVDGEVRGSARPVYVEPLDAYMFFLTIYGDEVEEMSFRCYDLATGEEYAINDRINYSVDAMLGSIEEPYMFRGTVGIGEATLSEINIYPNPTTTGREISFDATCETVEVFNTLGVKVAEYHYVDTIDAFETAGIYMIRITNNGNVQNCRVVVK